MERIDYQTYLLFIILGLLLIILNVKMSLLFLVIGLIGILSLKQLRENPSG